MSNRSDYFETLKLICGLCTSWLFLNLILRYNYKTSSHKLGVKEKNVKIITTIQIILLSISDIISIIGLLGTNVESIINIAYVCSFISFIIMSLSGSIVLLKESFKDNTEESLSIKNNDNINNPVKIQVIEADPDSNSIL
tara:strand:+ start:622 stop:1041 length:420 start_codon:yes stop_codon:yes gene_type:complete